jgi:hypothetical protein
VLSRPFPPDLMTTGETIMCGRYGCAILPDPKTRDFNRRNLLKTIGLTTLPMAVDAYRGACTAQINLPRS